MTKKARQPDPMLARIPEAERFIASLFLGRGNYAKSICETLDQARAAGTALEAQHANGKKALVYAMLPNTAQFLIPADYNPAPTPVAIPEKGNETMTTKSSKAKKAPAKTTAKKAAKAPAKAPAKKAAGNGEKKPRGGKVEKVLAMLRKGATRKEIAAAVEWPSINLKPIAARYGLKLKVAADGKITAADS